MIEFSRKLARLFLKTTETSQEPTPLKERYKQFRISLLVAITLIALVPSTLLSILSYFRYLDLAQQQSSKQIRWHLHYVGDRLDKHIELLKEITSRTASQLLPIHFESEDHLRVLLKSMKDEEESLVQIEIDDRNGHPIVSTSKTYREWQSSKDIPWFKQVPADGYTISDVETSPSPHFFLATRFYSDGSRGELLCRVVFLASSLEKQLKIINDNSMEDVFLVNNDMILQTSSHYFGDTGNQFTRGIPLNETALTSTGKKWGMGAVFYASRPMDNSPWHLILIKDGPVKKREWLTFQLSLVLIFLACAIGSFIIIRQLVNILTMRIRESDNKRMALLNEVGHTNRLATIGKLAAGVAHEINNPLAVIDQKAGLVNDILDLTENFSSKEKIQETLKGIHNSVDRCKVITHRLLGFARKMDIVVEKININDILVEVIGFLEKEALFSHINFQMHLQKDMPIIHTDRGQLQQIFLNIISNSIDAIGKNGTISVTTSIFAKGKIKVEIEDDGPGIKPEVMEHIFDPFFTTKETGEGTGLGLSITYGLTKKMGGDIKVHSSYGRGTTFYIYLPILTSKKKGLTHG